MLNRPEWIETAFAVLEIGAVLVPINTRLRTDDVADILEQSGARPRVLAEQSGPVDWSSSCAPGRVRPARLRRWHERVRRGCPMTSSGKIQKVKLREEALRRLS
jgi:acyl-CoA synthetase (AMP-forming)/AMP-acid ligase II